MRTSKPLNPKLSSKASKFVKSVLQLAPRLAVFDCDGTLWAGDAGEGFFDWELKGGMVADQIVRRARARYADYLAGKVSEDDMCAEMVTINRGLAEEDVQRAGAEYFEEKMARQIFPEMKKLVLRLQNAGCEVWAVSSTNEWVIRGGMNHFKIPPTRILAASVLIENGKITDKVIRVPSGKGKPQAIYDVIARTPDAVFGNSIWDAEMLEIAGHPFAINPTAELEAIAQKRQWPIYFPDSIPAS